MCKNHVRFSRMGVVDAGLYTVTVLCESGASFSVFTNCESMYNIATPSTKEIRR